MSLFWSALLGVGIGLLYAVMAYVTQRVAVKKEGSQFMRIVVGGMLLRMIVLPVVVGVLLAFVPVYVFAFVVPLVVTLLAGLGLDAWWMLRWLQSGSGESGRQA